MGVVERGPARCPRCVAVAEYTFTECGPNSVRYEVCCARCGEVYSELNTPVAPQFATDGAPWPITLPDSDVRPSGPSGQRALALLARARGRTSQLTAAAASSLIRRTRLSSPRK